MELPTDPEGTASESRRQRPPRGVDVGIPPRQLDFRLPGALADRVYADNATATCMLATLSAAFPPGEDFFVRSVNHFKHRVQDPELRARVAGFTGQEVIHSREHDRLNEAFAARGFDVRVPERVVEITLRGFDRLPARWRIASTAMMEHFTAVLGEDLLAGEEFRRRVHPDIVEMWLWHALEELEHKSVTYDVYEVIGNRRSERRLALGLVVAVVLPAVIASWGYLLVRQGVWRRPGDLRQGLRLLFGRDGFLRRVFSEMPRFLERDFHPARHDTSDLEAEWRAVLFGPEGRLNDQLRRRTAG